MKYKLIIIFTLLLLFVGCDQETEECVKANADKIVKAADDCVSHIIEPTSITVNTCNSQARINYCY